MKVKSQITDLKACPFCGNRSPVIQNLVDADDFFISCPECEVQQIANYTAAEAVRRWNHRLSSDARRCAEIASEVSNSYDKTDGFPSLHAVGAETVAVTIRREFGLDGKPPKFDLTAAATEMYEALKARMVLEDRHANCEDCEGEGQPEECGTCFPFADDARLKMRAAIAKVEGK